MANLSSILVQRGVASMRAVEDAIARQVFHGGDLPTNLLEVGAVREEALVPILAEQHGLPAAPIGRLPAPAARVLRLVPAELAERYGIFPLEQRGRALLVATAEPLSPSVEDDLGFALDLAIEQVVAPLIRIKQAIADHYGIPAERRFVRIAAKLEGQADPSPSAAPPPDRDLLSMRMPRTISVPSPSFGTGVPSSEPEPGRLYDKLAPKTPFVAAHEFVNPAIPKSPGLPAELSPVSGDVMPPPPVSDPAPPPEPRAAEPDHVTEAATPAEEPDQGPAPAAEEPPAALPVVTAVIPSRDPGAARALAGLVKKAVREERSASIDKTKRPAWRAANKRRGPFTAAMAEREMEDAKTSDEIAEIVFAFAQQFFEYCALFIVHADRADGRDAFGPGASRGDVLAIGVPLDLPSAVARVRSGRAPWIGRLAAEGLDADLARDLQRDARRAVAILPIVVRTRVVAFVFGDDGDADVELRSIGDVLAMIGLAGAALERIALRKKLGPRSPEIALRARAQEIAGEQRPAADASPATLARVIVRPTAVRVSEPPPEIEVGPGSDLAPDLDEADDATIDEPAREHEDTGDAALDDEPAREHEDTGDAALDDEPAREREDEGDAALDDEPTREHDDAGDEALDDEPTRVREDPAITFDDAPDTTANQAETPGYEAPPGDAGFAVSKPDEELLPPSQGPRTARYFDDVPTAAFMSLEKTTPGIGGLRLPDRPAPPPSPPPPAPDSMDAAEAPTLPHFEAVSSERRLTPSPLRRGLAPLYEGRGGPRSAPPIGFEPLPQQPPPNATAWQSFPSAPPPDSVLGRRRRSERPIPREDDEDGARAQRADHVALPSVVVDVGAEYQSLVQRVLDGGTNGQRAFDELLRSGDHAVQAVMARFPGPLRVDRHRARGELPAASQCGPILELTVAFRRTALPFVSSRISSTDPEIRFWAAHTLGELRYPEAASALLPRLFDDDPAVRRVARRSAAALVGAGAAGEPVLRGLEDTVKNREEPVPSRVLAIETMGEIRSAAMVKPLILALEEPSEDIVEAARRALLLITRQDFGRDAARWKAWWDENGSRHRIEWLIDALMHEQPSLRRAAGDELKLLTKEYFGYYDDLPKRERERAQGLYRSWWEREGRVRFG